MLREDEVRKKVKALKRFYMDIVNFILVSLLLTLIWMTFDRTGTYWPKYVMLVWGLALVFKAYRMGVIPLLFPHVSFLRQDWEERKVREIMRRRTVHRKAPLDKNEKEK